jgi:hypothetical protein
MGCHLVFSRVQKTTEFLMKMQSGDIINTSISPPKSVIMRHLKAEAVVDTDTFKIKASRGLKILYSFLYKKYVDLLNILLLPFLSCM